MAYSDLWSQVKYLAPYNYILDTNIVEFDIEKANINVLLYTKTISEETYWQLYNLPKIDREITVGRMIRRNPNMSSILKEGIQEARHRLFEQLQLDNNNVLAINNDAVFVLFNGPYSASDVQVNELIKFKVKGYYRSFYYLNKKQFYYSYNPVTNQEGLDIKGIGDYGIEKCNKFIKILCDIFYSYLSGGIYKAYETASIVYDNYCKKRYDVDVYRRLDSMARFDINTISNYCTFQADTLDMQFTRNAINPYYNEIILRTLLSYYTEVLFKT